MRHYFVDVGEFKIPLRLYLRKIGKFGQYDTVKRRFIIEALSPDGDIIIKHDSHLFKNLPPSRFGDEEVMDGSKK